MDNLVVVMFENVNLSLTSQVDMIDMLVVAAWCS